MAIETEVFVAWLDLLSAVRSGLRLPDRLYLTMIGKNIDGEEINYWPSQGFWVREGSVLKMHCRSPQEVVPLAPTACVLEVPRARAVAQAWMEPRVARDGGWYTALVLEISKLEARGG